MTAFRKEQNTGKLLELSDQVSRIATTLARLSAEQGFPAPGTSIDEPVAATEIPAAAVTAVIRARRLRAQYFSEELFADPAWDMMLDLFEAELAQRRVSVSSLCIAAAVPSTTALRWLKTLTERALVVRLNDPFDGRRVYVQLSAEASGALRAYFAKIAGAPAA
jgi:DNA-binding MarR family transcriptional regulator